MSTVLAASPAVNLTFPDPLSPANISGFDAFKVAGYANVVAISLLGHEYGLTFSDEVHFMWKGWNILSFVFFFNRYMPFVDVSLGLAETFINQPPDPQKTCITLFWIRGWLVWIGVNVADCILVLRTYAIWDNSKIIGGGLFIALLGTFIVEGVYQSGLQKGLIIARSPSPSKLPGCYPAATSGNSGLGTAFLTLAVFETVIFVITLYKLIQRQRGNFGEMPVLLKTLYRDGIMFYALIFSISLVNIVVLLANLGEVALVFPPIHRILHSLLATRLVLNIRRAAAMTLLGEQIEMSNLDDMVFAKQGNSGSRPTGHTLSSLGRFSNREPGVSRGESAQLYDSQSSPAENIGLQDHSESYSDKFGSGGATASTGSIKEIT